MQEAALSVDRLTVRFRTLRGEVKAVTDVSLSLPRGGVLAVVGESGSGKSVTARAIMGLVTSDNATVSAEGLSLAGRDLLTMAPEARQGLRGSAISLVFQDALSALNPVLTVGSQLAEPFRIHQGLSRRDARDRAVDLLRRVRIPSAERRINDYPHQFSGGMRQRLLIAVGIALNPEVLIADEPTTALDVTVQAQILDLLDELRRDLDMAILLITHDLGVVARLAEDVAVMYAGRIVETAPAERLFARPAHPYTSALFASAPRISVAAALKPIGGSPPDLVAPPQGCAFHPRCSRRSALCVAQRPPLMPTGAGLAVACHHPQDTEDGGRIDAG